MPRLVRHAFTPIDQVRWAMLNVSPEAGQRGPLFFWCPYKNAANFYRDQIDTRRRGYLSGAAGVKGQVDYHGITSRQMGLVFPMLGTTFPATKTDRFFVAALVSLDTATACTGAVIKIGAGAPDTGGDGLLCGDTDGDTPGSRVLTLAEGVSWGTPSSTTALTQGLNLFTWGKFTSTGILSTYADCFPGLNGLAVEASYFGGSAYNSQTTNLLSINAYDAGGRYLKGTVHMLAMYQPLFSLWTETTWVAWRSALLGMMPDYSGLSVHSGGGIWGARNIEALFRP